MEAAGIQIPAADIGNHRYGARQPHRADRGKRYHCHRYSNGTLDLQIDPAVLEERKKSWKLPEFVNLKKDSLLKRYRREVGNAMNGSVFE